MFAGRMMGGYGYGGLCIFGGLLTLILVVALLAGLVLLGIWLWRRYGEGNGFRLTSGPSRLEPSPREILEARYARGELTREEFRSMVQDLSQGQNRREQEEVEIMKTRNVVLGIGLGVAGLLIAALGVGAWLWSRASYGYGYGCGMYGMMGGYGLPWGILMSGYSPDSSGRRNAETVLTKHPWRSQGSAMPTVRSIVRNSIASGKHCGVEARNGGLARWAWC
jgi:putative membrane protein